MEEIKVGEYVRSSQGYISRVESIDEDFIWFEGPIWFNYEEDWALHLTDKYGRYDQRKDIVKHSFNIIDIIEVGDYVNGELIDFIVKDKDGKINFIIRDNILFFNKYNRIISIVTKEQFKAMEYKVKEN